MRQIHAGWIFASGLAALFLFEKYSIMLEKIAVNIFPNFPYFTYFDLSLVIIGFIGFVIWLIKFRDKETEKSILIKTPTYDENTHLQNLNTVYQKLFEFTLEQMGDNRWEMKKLKELNGKTPSDACGIEINGDNKWITLIQNANKREA